MRAAERVMLTPAYVLHQHDWRETSRVVEILSRDYGKLGVVARGARRAKSPWRALLRPFQPLLLSWMGGGELMTLIGAEPSAASHLLYGRSLLSGFYMNELLLRLLPRQDPHPVLFDQYADVLGRLMQDINPSLRLFEKHLLTALGYGLNLDRDAISGELVQADAVYRYEFELGLVRVMNNAGPGIHVSGRTLLALARERLEQAEALRESRRLLRAVLDQLLGERPLKTRKVMHAFGKIVE
ncbi:MAG: DNA repair protein RecO [Gammaproteobacteria bacterium]